MVGFRLSYSRPARSTHDHLGRQHNLLILWGSLPRQPGQQQLGGPLPHLASGLGCCREKRINDQRRRYIVKGRTRRPASRRALKAPMAMKLLAANNAVGHTVVVSTRCAISYPPVWVNSP